MPRTPLTFDSLRQASQARVPRFLNKHGVLAHSKPDGSDWNPAQWMQALLGELGELARVRLEYEQGKISREVFEREAAKEVADVQTYLDLVAARILDEVAIVKRPGGPGDASSVLLQTLAALGDFANVRKKFERGDYNAAEFDEKAAPLWAEASRSLERLPASRDAKPSPVIRAHPSGVDLGEATREKFNEVSARANIGVWLTDAGEVVVGPRR